MTDNTFMPAAEPEAGTSRTTLLVAGGLVAALVLGGGGYVLLSGGSDDLEVGTGAPSVTRTTTGTAAKPVVRKPAVKAPAAKILPAKTTVRIGRDPFKALYIAPVAAAEGSSTTPTNTSATGSTTGSSTGSSTPGTVTGAVYALTLKKISSSGETKLYTFDVAGTTKTVIASQRFGKYGELIVLGYIKTSKGTPVGALIQVGDDEPFGVRIGEKVTVQ